ncbi:MAG: GNAT family N-acetyltransferase [Bacteroidetes bacterium HGW-Bacteroidetes-17]|jgi:ribosomal protein S18 acetylase RimI-like enzyme|nr:MAG: GNAT family N-acetyltransferase [Bacteroidetes bacterium HGW-Bacteroidetes-17]
MLKTKIFNDENKPSFSERQEIVEFLYQHLEQFGDPKPHITKCIDYTLKDINSFGGFILVASEEAEILSAVVVNQTGMGGYIPENILVYIATHKDYRGKGIGKQLMQKAMEVSSGDIALHVEPNNPARFLYEKLGFTHKYSEMRFKKTN